jgi:hypothetical protein
MHLGLQDDGDNDPIDGDCLAENDGDQVLAGDARLTDGGAYQAGACDEDAPAAQQRSGKQFGLVKVRAATR